MQKWPKCLCDFLGLLKHYVQLKPTLLLSGQLLEKLGYFLFQPAGHTDDYLGLLAMFHTDRLGQPGAAFLAARFPLAADVQVEAVGGGGGGGGSDAGPSRHFCPTVRNFGG